jgi:hypothetical protein
VHGEGGLGLAGELGDLAQAQVPALQLAQDLLPDWVGDLPEAGGGGIDVEGVRLLFSRALSPAGVKNAMGDI